MLGLLRQPGGFEGVVEFAAAQKTADLGEIRGLLQS